MTHDQYSAACDAAWARQMARRDRADIHWARLTSSLATSEAKAAAWVERQAEFAAAQAEYDAATRAAREAWERAGGAYITVGRYTAHTA